MAVEGPLNITDPTLKFTVTVDGSAIQEKVFVSSIHISHEVNKISHADIVFAEGTGDNGAAGDEGSFPASDMAELKPGSNITVTAGYGDSTEVSIFKGVIVKQALSISKGTGFELVVTCKHNAVKMTLGQKEAEFSASTDSDAIQKIASVYGLSATVDSTSAPQEILFQKTATDWDFMLARAAFNGFITTLDDDAVTIGKPNFSAEAVLSVTYGDSIISFNAEVNAEKQPPSLDAYAWDPQTLALITSSAEEPTLNAQGDLTAKSLSEKLSQTGLKLISSAPLPKADLKTWADSTLLRLRMNALKGTVVFIGNAKPKPGKMLELVGVGPRFSGKAFINKVRHVLEDGQWTTHVQFGAPDKPIFEKEQFSAVPANGQMPAIHGLQLAKVVKISEDPASQYRVQVKPASNASEQKGIWARLASYYATSSAGAVFCPEVGDEVILGFLESDPRYPVILGSLFSKSNVPPLTQGDEKNNTKALYSRSLLQISFDDDKKVIKITTPGNNMITLSDDGKSIEIKDQQSNSIKLDDSGILLNSAKDITLKATGNISLQATGKATLKATQDLELNGMNIKQTAQIGFTAKGTATAELSASGQTVVKGGMVMIN
ncbi:type VI secretion system tip protein VgrG [Chitinophaga rhizophila]|uniref:Type VI secretion system tip protein VgrG n=1 Tax=Chitinophaga rhizophila TaxID=2866212 RepID=A0ABS7GHA9_9BACT|nr:type VI secretion system tip protein VgrG [Chitinophaga rhizophila]MBW8686811.1 type VI secretion system tip protein VgrG [Chitinophaga rhizophila]